MDAFPLLPVEEEGRLTDLHLRDNFITRVFSYRRSPRFGLGATRRPTSWRSIPPTSTCCSPTARRIRQAGRLVADLKRVPRAEWIERYGQGFLEALRAKATTRKHVNVLQHIMGFFKDHLTAGEKRELLGLIADTPEASSR
jgi:hypothetical protein